MMKVTEDVGKWAVRLEGLPWKWIKASRLFDSIRELHIYAEAFSKDAPYSLIVAVDSRREGFESVTFEPAPGSPLIRGSRSSTIMSIERVFVPLGFAHDVEGWAGEYWPLLPKGEWVDFCDLTRIEEEGGDADRYFAAHYVGPSWWVVPFPATDA